MAAYQARGRAGKPTTSEAIYGYVKDPEDKHHWLIDEEAAAVVRRIFHLSVNGHGPYEIARILQQEKVERPSCYLARHGRGTMKNTADMARPYDWRGTTVSALLSKPEYMGHTVNFRSHKESYKDKRGTPIPPEEWLIFENTHEAIVDPETWELAQRVKGTVRRTDSTGIANPLTGLLYCADCGCKMTHHQPSPTKKKVYDADDYYLCGGYRQLTRDCTIHYIKTSTIEKLVLTAIREVSAYVREDEKQFIRIVRDAASAGRSRPPGSRRSGFTKSRSGLPNWTI